MSFSVKRKVSYFHHPGVGKFHYALGHLMKPFRIEMTHNLLVAYGLFDKMNVLPIPSCPEQELNRFHSKDYVQFLKSVTLDNLDHHLNKLPRFKINSDCPIFDGLWEFCQISAGGSLAGAAHLNEGRSSIAINWAGGHHHAKKSEASGFCYVNDCVLAILELLRVHARVLYVDIDVHHGDGVERAFYTTDRVMTASFHKFGNSFFPQTGDCKDIGSGRGKHYSVNFPLHDGIDDDNYREIFIPVMSHVMNWYQPGAVVLQCGADSLSGDRLGTFNLSLFGHGQCVDFFKGYDVPLLILGGGGYTVRNVARCWAYETSRAVGETLSDTIPANENYEYYGPDFRLHISPSNRENQNSADELQKTTEKIFESLREIPHAPSTPFLNTPRGGGIDDILGDSEPDMNSRAKNRRAKMVVDYAGSDDEDEDQYVFSLRRATRRGSRINFPPRRRFAGIGIGSVSSDVVDVPDEHSPRKDGRLRQVHSVEKEESEKEGDRIYVTSDEVE